MRNVILKNKKFLHLETALNNDQVVLTMDNS